MAHANPQIAPATRLQGPRTPRTGHGVLQRSHALSRTVRMVQLGSVRRSHPRHARTLHRRVRVRVRTRLRGKDRIRGRDRGGTPASAPRARILLRCSRLVLSPLWIRRQGTPDTLDNLYNLGTPDNLGIVARRPDPTHPAGQPRPAPTPLLTRTPMALRILREPVRLLQVLALQQVSALQQVLALQQVSAPQQVLAPAQPPTLTSAISRTRAVTPHRIPQNSSPRPEAQVRLARPGGQGRTEAKHHLGERSEDRAGERLSPSL